MVYINSFQIVLLTGVLQGASEAMEWGRGSSKGFHLQLLLVLYIKVPSEEVKGLSLMYQHLKTSSLYCMASQTWVYIRIPWGAS